LITRLIYVHLQGVFPVLETYPKPCEAYRGFG